MAHIQRLLDAGLPGEQIGVITPYNGQVAALRELRGDREAAVEISSVDGFQGRRDTLQLTRGKKWSNHMHGCVFAHCSRPLLHCYHLSAVLLSKAGWGASHLPPAASVFCHTVN